MTQFDRNGLLWEKMVDKILVDSCHIVVLHGAGSFNGISVADANNLLNNELIPRMETLLKEGRVSVIYDGDNDDPQYPDIGHIMGRLCDHFGNQVDWYAVQMYSWYRYRKDDAAQGAGQDLKPLHSANGNEYCTVIFPDKTFAGDHDYFSQHTRLVRSPNYEQWYVGACGLIASKQLADFSTKVAGVLGDHKAVIFRAPVSIEQEMKIHRKIAESVEPAIIQRLKDSLARRAEYPYGLLCTAYGEFILKPEYSNLTIEVV